MVVFKARFHWPDGSTFRRSRLVSRHTCGSATPTRPTICRRCRGGGIKSDRRRDGQEKAKAWQRNSEVGAPWPWPVLCGCRRCALGRKPSDPGRERGAGMKSPPLFRDCGTALLRGPTGRLASTRWCRQPGRSPRGQCRQSQLPGHSERPQPRPVHRTHPCPTEAAQAAAVAVLQRLSVRPSSARCLRQGWKPWSIPLPESPPVPVPMA